MCPGPEAFLDQVVGGRWRLLEVLGATEDGALFRAEAIENGRPARLQLWEHRHVERRGELARFEREARTLSRLRHERCLSVVDFGAHEGRPFLVSDLPEGTSLRDAIGKPELTVPRALSLGLQLCDALAHLHRHGVVHRALLADNLWVDHPTASEVLKLGLPRFERSPARPDHRADLYAAGRLLYAMCTGREPPAEGVASVGQRAAVAPPRTVSPERGITEGLERVILRALAPSPEVRFGTAGELMAALQSAGARATSPKRRPAQPPRKRTALLATAFAAVALVAAGALRSSGGQAPAAPPAALAAQPPGAPSMPSTQPQARVATAAPPVETTPEPAPPAVSARAAPMAATTIPAAPADDGDRRDIWSLLDTGRLDEGATRIKALVAKDPEAAWPRLALGVLYYRRYWRRDSIRQWQLAVTSDPEIRHDPQFSAYLCFMLDDTWTAAGVTDLLEQLGTAAVPLLDHCVQSAKTPRLRSSAARALRRMTHR
ncbi:MAG: serine/threonine-protein kinase [Pseudomonadota bacterium]